MKYRKSSFPVPVVQTVSKRFWYFFIQCGKDKYLIKRLILTKHVFISKKIVTSLNHILVAVCYELKKLWFVCLDCPIWRQTKM